MPACKSKTRNGTSCRAPASAGGRCFFHADPERPKRLGKIGGQKNRRSAASLEIPDNLDAAGLRKMNIEVMRLLLSGEMHAREACAFVQLSNSYSRIFPIADLEARLAVIEEQNAQNGPPPREEAKPSPDTELAASLADGTELVEVEQPARNEPLPQEEINQPPDTDSAAPFADKEELVEMEQPAGSLDAAQEEEYATESIVEGSDEGEDPL